MSHKRSPSRAGKNDTFAKSMLRRAVAGERFPARCPRRADKKPEQVYDICMQKIGRDITRFVSSLVGDNEQARINLRANQVRERYKRALEVVYRDTAPLFLAHTNNVYIMKKDDVRTLIVYVDDSIIATELNAQRELIKLHLLQLFGEDVEAFEIYVSKPKFKKNHPYLVAEDGQPEKKAPSVPLDDEERNYVYATVQTVEDERLRESLRKAMTADLEWKKGENRIRS